MAGGGERLLDEEALGLFHAQAQQPGAIPRWCIVVCLASGHRRPIVYFTLANRPVRTRMPSWRGGRGKKPAATRLSDNGLYLGRELVQDQLLKLNLFARVVDVNANKVSFGVIVHHHPSEISRLSTLGCSEGQYNTESVSA